MARLSSQQMAHCEWRARAVVKQSNGMAGARNSYYNSALTGQVRYGGYVKAGVRRWIDGWMHAWQTKKGSIRHG